MPPHFRSWYCSWYSSFGCGILDDSCLFLRRLQFAPETRWPHFLRGDGPDSHLREDRPDSHLRVDRPDSRLRVDGPGFTSQDGWTRLTSQGGRTRLMSQDRQTRLTSQGEQTRLMSQGGTDQTRVSGWVVWQQFCLTQCQGLCLCCNFWLWHHWFCVCFLLWTIGFTKAENYVLNHDCIPDFNSAWHMAVPPEVVCSCLLLPTEKGYTAKRKRSDMPSVSRNFLLCSFLL